MKDCELDKIWKVTVKKYLFEKWESFLELLHKNYYFLRNKLKNDVL